MGDAPQSDCDERDDGDEPLDAGEAVFHAPDWHDRGSSAGVKGDQEQSPDQKDRDDADGERDEEPDSPGRLGVHVQEGDEVLRRSDRGGGATDVGR